MGVIQPGSIGIISQSSPFGEPLLTTTILRYRDHVKAFDSFDGGIIIYSDNILKSLRCLQKAQKGSVLRGLESSSEKLSQSLLSFTAHMQDVFQDHPAESTSRYVKINQIYAVGKHLLLHQGKGRCRSFFMFLEMKAFFHPNLGMGNRC